MRSPSPVFRRHRRRDSRSPRRFQDDHDRRDSPRSRSRSPVWRKGNRPRSNSPRRRHRSPSPSPPRPTKRDLQAIRISAPNIQAKRSKDEGKPLCQRRDRDGALPRYHGSEDDLPRTKDQRKIQIEISRNIPRERANHSPVRRSIRDPNTVFINRRDGKRKIILHMNEFYNLPHAAFFHFM